MKKKIIFNYPNLTLALINIFSLWIIMYFIRVNNYDYHFLAAIALLGVSWLMVIASRIFNIKIPNVMYLVFYAFVILALMFGALLDFYTVFHWYDDFMHFSAGILLSILGIFIIVKLDNIGYLKFSVLLTFMIFFVGFSTAIWEIIEFTIDTVFNLDVQRVAESGVTNTMLDIIMGLLGALVIVILLIIDNAFYKNKFLEKLIKKF